MSTAYKQFIDAGSNSRVIGACATYDDGSISFNSAYGSPRTLCIKFSIPRSAEPGRGSTLKAVNLVYELLSDGVLTSITPLLKKVTLTNNQEKIVSTITTTSDAFTLEENASLINRNTTTITNPTIDNYDDDTSVFYYLVYTFVSTADSVAVVRVYGVDVVYLLTTGISGVATSTTGTGVIPSTSGFHQITTTGAGDAITLANGTPGQHLYILYVGRAGVGNTAVVSPATFVGASIITFTQLGQSAHLLYGSNGWYFIEGTAAAGP